MEVEMTATRENFVCNGLVAICCVCKRVRNDQGFWRRLDAGEINDLGGLVTHGMCERCVMEHSYERLDEAGNFYDDEGGTGC
jgi:hypothetical protein